MKRIFALLLAVIVTCPAMAAWTLESAGPLEPNTSTMMTLVRSGVAPGTSSTLWLTPTGTPEVIVPHLVTANSDKVFVPVFARGVGKPTLTVLDSTDKSKSTIVLDVVPNPHSGKKQWLPLLKLEGEDGLPVVYANRPTTAILQLEPGDGPMPPTTHISATDHRGRMVISRFYRTFELAAGSETVELPTAGDYMMTVKLVSDAADEMPQARYRSPIPIAFGRTTTDFEASEIKEGVTTHSVVGSRVALEHLPTTATVVSIDRLRVVALGRPSREMQKNRWPYVIAGADLGELSSEERVTVGARRLTWQRRLGSSYAPVTVEWAKVQRSPGSFYWSPLANVLPLYRKLMVRPLLTVIGRAAWNNQFPAQTTGTLAAWQNLVSGIGDNYMTVMWGMYCWDQPERTWPNPAEYRQVLLATAEGLQVKNGEKRPSSALITGSLAKFNETYLDAVLTTETIPRLNGIAFDLFPADMAASPELNGLEDSLKKAAELLRRKDAEQLGIWLTGSGWPVGSEGVTPELQANYMVRTHVLALANGAEKITWCDLLDRPPGPSRAGARARQGKWGLLDERMMPKSSGVAYNVMTYILSGVTSPTVTRQGTAKITSFNLPVQSNKWAGTVYVAWTDSPQKQQSISLDMKHGGGVYAFDYLGAEIPTKRIAGDTADPISGTYSLTVGYEPVYIWDAGRPTSTGGR